MSSKFNRTIDIEYIFIYENIKNINNTNQTLYYKTDH